MADGHSQDRNRPQREGPSGRTESRGEPEWRRELERRLAEERRALLRQARDDFYDRTAVFGRGYDRDLEDQFTNEQQPGDWYQDYPEPGPGQAYGADYGRLIYGRQRYGREYGGRGYGQDFPAGGAAPGSRWNQAGPYRGHGPKGYVRSDERIREDVCERLSDSPYVDAREIEVYCSQGIIRLEGRVDSRATKRYVEALADSCPGVRDVENRLTIAGDTVSQDQKPGPA